MPYNYAWAVADPEAGLDFGQVEEKIVKYKKGKNDDNIETKRKSGWSHYCSVFLQLQVTPHICISYGYWIYPEASSKIHGLKVVV